MTVSYLFYDTHLNNVITISYLSDKISSSTMRCDGGGKRLKGAGVPIAVYYTMTAKAVCITAQQ